MRVLHVISGLGKGGAETMLMKLVGEPSRYRHEIVSLAGMGDLGDDIVRLGVPLRTVSFHQPRRIPASFWQLRRILASAEDAIVVAWMNHGIFFSTLAHRSARLRVPLLWNVRQTLGDMHCETATTRGIIRLNAKLSRAPDRIIYNSVAGARDHEAMGFDASKRSIIGNGFALDQFAPDETARAAVRAELGIAPDEVVFGLFARVHPIKNHAGLIGAAERLRARFPKARLLLVGLNADANEPSFRALFSDRETMARSIMLGSRSDIARLTRAMDVGCNVSFQEGFSNAIGEAMACAVPCLVTDAGDSAAIVDDTGIVCGDSSAEAIAEGMAQFLALDVAERRRMGQRARERMERCYSLHSVVEDYERLFDAVAQARGLHAPDRKPL